MSKLDITQIVPPDEYVFDTYDLAEKFYKASRNLNNLEFDLLMPAGYCAAHAAELYLKSMIVANDCSRTLYRKITTDSKIRHSLVELLAILCRYDSEAIVLRTTIERLNKYSADKVRYVEDGYDESSEKVFGNDDLWGIEQVAVFAKRKLYFE